MNVDIHRCEGPCPFLGYSREDVIKHWNAYYKNGIELKYTIEKRIPDVGDIIISNMIGSGAWLYISKELRIIITPLEYKISFKGSHTVIKIDSSNAIDKVISLVSSCYPIKDGIKGLSVKVESIVKNQNEILNMLKSLFAHSDNSIVSDDPNAFKMDRLEYVLKLQEQCKSLIYTHAEYQPGSEKVLSLGEEFDKLKTISKLG